MVQNEFNQDGIVYVPSKVAAKSVDLSSDYISRMCRDGSVLATWHRGSWYVHEPSLLRYLADRKQRQDEANRAHAERLRREREESAAIVADKAPLIPKAPTALARRTSRRRPVVAFSLISVLLIATSAVAIQNSTVTKLVVQLPFDAFEAISQLHLQLPFPDRTQLASAATSDTLRATIDRAGTSIYKFFCPYFSDCGVDASLAAEPGTSVAPRQATTPQQVRSGPTLIPAQQLPARVAQPSIAQTTINQPIIERVVETVRTIVQGGIDAAVLDARIAALDKDLTSRMTYQTNRTYDSLSDAPRIEELTDVTMHDLTVDGVFGLADADIPDAITASNYLPLSGGALTGDLSLSGTLTAGTLSVAGVSSGGAISAPYFTATSTTASSTFPNLNATNATTTNATSTNLYSTFARVATAIIDTLTATAATITNLTATTIVATNATSTRIDALDYVAVGRTATTTIRGDGVASIIPYASSTAITASGSASTSNLVVSNSFTLGALSGILKATAGAIASAFVNLASDVVGILPVANGGTGWANIASAAIPYGNGSGALATTTAGTNGQVLAFLNGAPTWAATSTLSTISGTLDVGKGGTGASLFSYGLVVSPGGAAALSNIATSSLGLLTTHVAEGSNLYYQDARVQTYLGTVDKGFFFGTTSADAWKLTRSFFATTSTDYWKSVTDLFSTTSATYFAHSSTTIPKLYSSNTWTGNNIFSALTLASLNGPLHANAGVLSATSSIGVFYGGTGLTSAPTYGQLLVGNSSGGYTLTATSSLGISGGASLTGTTGQFAYFSGTNTAVGTSSLFIATSGNVGIGTTTPWGKLSINSTAGIPQFVIGSSTTQFIVDASGNVGIGTTTPPAKLSVWGDMEIGAGSTANLRAYNTSRAANGFLTLYDGSTGNVSLGTTFSTGNVILSPGASGNVGIGTSTPSSMLTVYGDTLFNGTSRYANFGTVSGSTGYGVRDNAGVVEFKNSGGTWQPVGADGPAFSVHKNGTDQTNVGASPTLITWSTETFDTNNNFASNRFTPTVPGKYLLTATLYYITLNADDHGFIIIYKNGAQFISTILPSETTEASAVSVSVTAVVEANGSTDYFEVYGDTQTVANETVSGGATATYFTGALIRGADYAEYMQPEAGTTPADYPEGTLLCLKTSSPDTYGKCDTAKDEKLVGAISTYPAYIGNAPVEGTPEPIVADWKAKNILMAMTGRVTVRVNTEGGMIRIGDRITQSSVPGVGMKASGNARTLGIALADQTSPDDLVYIYIQPEYTIADSLKAVMDSFAEMAATSSAASTTPEMYVSGFFSNLFARMSMWLADASNGITNFFAQTVHTQKICTTKSDGTEVCATNDQLAALLSQSPAPQVANPSPTSAPGIHESATSTLPIITEPATTSSAIVPPEAAHDDPEPDVFTEPATSEPLGPEPANDNSLQPTEATGS